MVFTQGAVSLTATDCPTGRRTILQCYLSIGRMVRLRTDRSDGPSLLVKHPPGLQRANDLRVPMPRTAGVPSQGVQGSQGRKDYRHPKAKKFRGPKGPRNARAPRTEEDYSGPAGNQIQADSITEAEN